MDIERKKRLALRLELNKTAQLRPTARNESYGQYKQRTGRDPETMEDLLRKSTLPVSGPILSPSIQREMNRDLSTSRGGAEAMFRAAVEAGDPEAQRLLLPLPAARASTRPASGRGRRSPFAPPRSDLPIDPPKGKSVLSLVSRAPRANSTPQTTSAGPVNLEKAEAKGGGPATYSSGTPSVFKIQKGQGYAHLAAKINKQFKLKGDNRVTAKSLFKRMDKQYLSAGRGYKFRAGDFSPTKKDVSLAEAGGLSQKQVTQRAKARAASLAKMKKPRLILGKPLPPGMGLRIADQVPRPAPKPSFAREAVLGAQAPKP